MSRKEERHEGSMAHDNAMESHLKVFIAKADKKRRKEEGERPAEATYMELVSHQEQKSRQALLWDQLRYHERMLASHTENYRRVSAYHNREIARLEAELGITDENESNEGDAS